MKISDSIVQMNDTRCNPSVTENELFTWHLSVHVDTWVDSNPRLQMSSFNVRNVEALDESEDVESEIGNFRCMLCSVRNGKATGDDIAIPDRFHLLQTEGRLNG